MRTTLVKIAIGGIVSIAIILGVIFSGILPGGAKGTNPAALPPPALSEWKSYTNERFQYTFKYPSDWYLNELPTSEAVGIVQVST